MFKQTSQSGKEIIGSINVIDKLEAITSEQLIEFAKLTGRVDTNFKIGKTADVDLRKELNFKIGKPAFANS